MIKYYAFARVIELQSISKAAESLGYSQPGLSHIISAFEEECGFPLIVKAKKSIQPTENGLKVLDYCYKLIEIERQLKQEIEGLTNKNTGSLRIGTPNSLLVGIVTSLVNDFTVRYPNTEINLQEATLADVRQALHERKLDLAFITNDVADSFKYYPLFEDNICIAMHENHPLAKEESLTIDMLTDYDFIMQIRGWDDIARKVTDKMKTPPKVKYYSASDFASLAMVSIDLGIYIVSELQASLLPSNVVIRSFKDKITRNVGVASRSAKEQTQIQKEFIALTQSFIEKKRLRGELD